MPAASPARSAFRSGGSALTLALYVTVIFGWSTSWYALALQVGPIPSTVSLMWRFALAAVMMLGIVLARRERLIFPLKVHLTFAIMGSVMFSLNFLCFYIAGHKLPSGLLSVVFSLASIINMGLGLMILKQRPTGRMVLGATLGIIGIGLMFAPQMIGHSFDHQAFAALGLCVLGTFFFCSGNIISARLQTRGIPVVSMTFWGMFYGACLMALVCLGAGYSFAVEGTASYLLALIWSAVISSTITFLAYLTLIGRIGSARTGYATVMFPVIALIISTFMEGYQWTLPAVLGLASALAGNVAMMKR